FVFGLLSFFLPILTGCSGSNDESSKEEILTNQSVFASEDVDISLENSNETVAAFDDNNRPVVHDNCPTHQTDDPRTPVTCEPGFELRNDKCEAICKDSQTFAQGRCFDNEKNCEVDNGEGLSRWMANAYSLCRPTRCDDGFKIVDNQCQTLCKDGETFRDGKCLPDVASCQKKGKKGVKILGESGYSRCHVSKKCDVKNGHGLRMFDLKTLSYGKCDIANCKKGFKKSKNKKRCVARCNKQQVFNGRRCLPRIRNCPIAGGSGNQTWNARQKRYGRCLVQSCDNGFVRRGNSCQRRWVAANDNGGGDGGGGEGDPLIVDLGSNINEPQGIRLTSQLQGILFDLLGLNSTPEPFSKKQISWTNQSRYRFVVRPNKDGQVLGINEMFGDNTLGPDDQFSKDGFEALAKFDADKNGLIDTEDPVYAELYLWHDANANGVSDPGELTSLMQEEVSSIDLEFDPNFFEIDKYGNKTTYKSVVKFNDGRQSLIFDLWFRYLEPPKNQTDTPQECPVDGKDHTASL
ncbi:MAG: hypothetical protein AAF203_08725, partial [Pseudomonadota bacterium]